ncbi:hypothetical protein QUF80_14245 [Desulfococcaceae bacterium HSG8]|nr:hypothetical protein [Desulfococcaceae bacterium HSG8]
MAEIRIFVPVLIFVLVTFGNATAREVPPGQETVRSHTGGGQNTSPTGEVPCGKYQAERNSGETAKQKEICLRARTEE